MATMDQVAQVREKIDIVSLISEYLPLKKLGRNFKVNCPFHSEKTPSFVVSPERQIWHCFGCQKGGDCFTFLMEYEHLEFPEALRILAKKAGVELVSSRFETGISSQKEKIYAMNHQAMELYHYILVNHNAGKKALLYLAEKRGIKPQVINTFMLGFSPPVGEVLSKYLIQKKQHTKEELIESGLSRLRGRDVVDFFQGRIMFPLFDHRDNVIGFSGRTLDDQSFGSKYINTKETLVYHKGDVFFGLNSAKNEIKKEGKAIIMEGEFDVISAFQEGIGNAVAVKGTALTDNQVRLILRFAEKISLCFDQDRAGQEAVKRSLISLEKRGATVTVVVISHGKDPDEAIKTDPFAFKQAVKNDVGVYDFLLLLSLREHNKDSIEGKRKITDELLPLFSHIENEIIKEHYLKKLSLELDTSYESILRQIEKYKKEEVVGKISNIVQISAKDYSKKKMREEVLEEYLLSLILQATNPKGILKNVLTILSDWRLRMPSYQKIIDRLSLYIHDNETQLISKEGIDSKLFLKTLPSELVSAFDTCFLFPLPKFLDEQSYENEVVKITKELKVLYLRQKIKELGDKISEKEKNEENKELEILQKEFLELTSRLSKTKQ